MSLAEKRDGGNLPPNRGGKLTPAAAHQRFPFLLPPARFLSLAVEHLLVSGVHSLVMTKRIALLAAAIAVLVLLVQVFLRATPAPVEPAPRAELPPRSLATELPVTAPVDVRGSPARAASAVPEPVDVEASAPPAPDGSRRFAFFCADGNWFAVRVLDGEASVFSPSALGADMLTLTRTDTAVGARYASQDAVYWNKGDAATFELRGRVYADCAADAGRAREAEARSRGAIFRAIGNEPPWVLEISPLTLTLTSEGGRRSSEFPRREPTVVGPRTTYRSFVGTSELVVVLDRAPCNDSLSGELFDATVAVTFEGATSYGCGRAPR